MMDKIIAETREIVGRLDERTSVIQEDVAAIKKDYGPRLRKVENRQHWLLGAGAAAAALATGAWQWIKDVP